MGTLMAAAMDKPVGMIDENISWPNMSVVLTATSSSSEMYEGCCEWCMTKYCSPGDGFCHDHHHHERLISCHHGDDSRRRRSRRRRSRRREDAYYDYFYGSDCPSGCPQCAQAVPTCG